jgi:hypothetical protein
VDECFAGRPAYQREIYDRMIAYLRGLGPVHADVVKVGVFLKHQGKLAEVRPKARSLSLALMLRRVIEDPRIARVLPPIGDRFVHIVKLTSADDFDDQVREWLTEAYDEASV